MNRREILKAGTGSIAALAAGWPCIGPAHAADWPTKQIRVVVPYAPGSATDLVPRTVLAQVGEQVGQSFVIENRPGGGTTVGSAQVKQSDPDGYTMLVHSNAIVTVPAIQASVPYDPVADFSAITPLGNVPLVLVVANNHYAYSTPSSRQFACRSLVDKAAGYGVASHSLDGTDLADCLKVIGEAIQCARQGEGPQLIVARLLRLCGHGEHDDAHYIDPKLKQSPVGRDCLQVAEEFLVRQGWADGAALKTWYAEAIHKIEEAVATVQREAGPDPYKENWCALATHHLSEGK